MAFTYHNLWNLRMDEAIKRHANPGTDPAVITDGMILSAVQHVRGGS